MTSRSAVISLLLSLAALSGCAESERPLPIAMTFQRGQQLLAAGSPKSAIPFLAQTITAAPDGPEPVALLALAYALDHQDERAIVQAQQVHRPQGSPPGWEYVALGIAHLSQHQPAQALPNLQHVAAEAPKGTALSVASQQWLTLGEVLASDRKSALASLQKLSSDPQMRSSALLWMVILYAQQGQTKPAGEALIQCAKAGVTESGQLALKSDLSAADDQTVYDAAVAALANADLPTAQRLFDSLRLKNPLGTDAPLWDALIAGAQQNWQTCRALLRDACLNGSTDSRGMSSQLFSVVCAMEDRPDDMIEAMLAGQRLLGRNQTPAYIVDQPKPEPVWFSDSMK